jgi:hypothetical protein
MSALQVYKDDLSKKGKIHLWIPNQFGSNGLKGEDPYQGQIIIVPKGSYLLGIVGFEKEESVEDRFKEFMRNTR